MIRGAEAEIEIGEKVIKKRAPKKYRHPELDRRLRTDRTRTESRLLKEADRAGADVPKVLDVSEETLELEKIEGEQLKDVLEKRPELTEELGENLAKLHSADIIHGDLTTSNAIVDEKLHIIDFGLAERSQRIEDRAVDVHLLKQVLNASHPGVADEAWKSFLNGYSSYEKFDAVKDRLEEVEGRGRYK